MKPNSREQSLRMTESSDGNSQIVVQRLLDQLRAGEDFAADELINASMDRLRQLSRKILADIPGVKRWEDTDDVLQNASLRLWKALSNCHPLTPLDYFRLASAVIRRELIDLARHYFGKYGIGKNHAPSGIIEGEKLNLVEMKSDETSDPQKLGSWTEFHEYVNCLPDDERSLFDLLWYQGLTLDISSKILDLPERTLRRRWKNARIQVYRELLEDRSID
jgi:RNA polymerase sigma factor (sigma-70 family)